MNIKEFDLKKSLIIITFSIVLVAVVFNLNNVLAFLKTVFNIFSPIFMGIIIAFVLNILMVKYEKLIYKKDIKNGKQIKGIKRILSIILTIRFIKSVLFFNNSFMIS